jgi:hypothetical protein
MVQWKLESLSLKLLKENKKNPRQIKKESVERLQVFIEKFGLIDKPIVNMDYTIIGGHQRVRILKKKKEKVVECWVPDRMLTEEETDEMCIGLNLHQGAWCYDTLANEWEPLDLLKWGFSEEQLLGTCKEAEEILEKEQSKEKDKKKHECPNCGCEF